MATEPCPKTCNYVVTCLARGEAIAIEICRKCLKQPYPEPFIASEEEVLLLEDRGYRLNSIEVFLRSYEGAAAELAEYYQGIAMSARKICPRAKYFFFGLPDETPCQTCFPGRST
jgi:hypothetical protein